MSPATLSPELVARILQVLEQHPAVTRALVFGSRAKGTSRAASDVDLALEGPTEPIEIARIAGDLEELPVPVRFDVQALAAITHAGLREHIGRVGIRIYPRAAGTHRAA